MNDLITTYDMAEEAYESAINILEEAIENETSASRKLALLEKVTILTKAIIKINNEKIRLFEEKAIEYNTELLERNMSELYDDNYFLNDAFDNEKNSLSAEIDIPNKKAKVEASGTTSIVMALGLTALAGVALYKFGDSLLEDDCTETFNGVLY